MNDAMKSKAYQIGEFLVNNLGMDCCRTMMEYHFKDLEQLEKLELEVLKHFTCSRCGRCCVECEVQLNDDDIIRLCKHLHIDFDEFYELYMNKGHLENYLLTPCPFFSGNDCTVYAARPHVCRTFPFAEEVLTVDPCKLGATIYQSCKQVAHRKLREKHITDNKITEMVAKLGPDVQERIDLRDKLIEMGQTETTNNYPCELCFVDIGIVSDLLKEFNKQQNRRETIAKLGIVGSHGGIIDE